MQLTPCSLRESFQWNLLIWHKGEVIGHNEKTGENKLKEKDKRFGTQIGGVDLNHLTLILLSGCIFGVFIRTNDIILRAVCNNTHRNINADLNAPLCC